jgi:signal-transduction protein with cAMP-binding, CBS, and nucleotidyltransferase domain
MSEPASSEEQWRRLDRLVDEASMLSFPASDPPAVFLEEPARTRSRALPIPAPAREAREDRMKIGDSYRHGVFTIDASTTLGTCARRLETADVGAFGVVEGFDIVGIIIERDLVRALARKGDPAEALVRTS